MKTSVYEKAISSTQISSITIIRQDYSSHYWSKPTKCFTTGTRLEMLFNKTTLNYDLSFEKIDKVIAPPRLFLQVQSFGFGLRLKE